MTRGPMKEINLQLTIDEANLILEALGNLPFIKVYALIGKSLQSDYPFRPTVRLCRSRIIMVHHHGLAAGVGDRHIQPICGISLVTVEPQ